MSGGEMVLAARNLVVRDASGRVLVDGVDVGVRPGERVGIVGESGAGKTLTLRACLGLLPEGLDWQAEELALCGCDLRGASARELRKTLGTRVGFIPQNTMEYLHPLMRVRDQMIDGYRTWRPRTSRAQAIERARELLASVGIEDPMRVLAARPGELSGGMRQRVNIACALMGDPELLVADEPTASLDVRVARQAVDLIARIARERGTAVVMVSHDLQMVMGYCDRLVVMAGGHVVEQGPTSQVLLHPREAYTRSLLAARPRLGEVLARREAEAAQAAQIAGDEGRLDAARADGGVRPEAAGTGSAARAGAAAGGARTGSATNVARAGAAAGGAPVLEARDVVRTFRLGRGRELRAVDGASCVLRAGHTLGVVGESGSGKSTLGEVLGGLQDACGGSVAFEGTDVRELSRAGRRAYRRGVQFVFQDPLASINPSFTVARALADPQRVLLPDLDRAHIEARSRAMLGRVGLDADRVMGVRAQELSGGQCQRVAIARALVCEPRVIVCDECTSALDVSVQAQILDLLAELQATLGCAYLFISHDMGAVARLADEVLVMRGGRVVEAGPVTRVLGSPRAAYTRELIEAAFGPDAAPGAAMPAQVGGPGGDGACGSNAVPGAATLPEAGGVR